MKPDHVDEIVAQWSRERPDIDVAAMAIIGRIARLNQMIRPRLDTVFADHELESWEFDVLATLLRVGPPHRLTPGELLESMMITSGAMTNRIQRLEQRGFVERIKSSTDGRQVLVTLTDDGRRKVDAALVDHAANQADVIAPLSPSQQRQLVNLLRTLGHAVADRSDRPASP